MQTIFLEDTIVILFVLVASILPVGTLAEHPLAVSPSPDTMYMQLYTIGRNAWRYLTGRPFVERHLLPPCFVDDGAIATEWGERLVASQWTRGYCSSVLEFGGGSGSVSAVIQMNLENPKNHVVIQPNDDNAMFGGVATLERNKNSCQMSFAIIDHVLRPGEGKSVSALVDKPFDCIVADCENCLHLEYIKNPDLFGNVNYIQVERDDKKALGLGPTQLGPYDELFNKLDFIKVHSGTGCGGARCATEVWKRNSEKS